MFILRISKTLYQKFFSNICQKNKWPISTSYEIICTFNCISKFTYEEVVFDNPVIFFNLHTSFPQNRISTTNSTITQFQHQLKSAAEFCSWVTHFFISKAGYSDLNFFYRCRNWEWYKSNINDQNHVQHCTIISLIASKKS